MLLDAVRRHPVERFLLISSSEVYGTAERDPMDEEHPLNPRSPYAATKAGGDRLVYSYVCTYDMPAVILRPFNNYGPYQHPEKVIPRFITQALQRPAADGARRRARRAATGCSSRTPRAAIAAALEAPMERDAGRGDQRRDRHRRRRARDRRAHPRRARQAALADPLRRRPPRPGRPPHRLDRQGRASCSASARRSASTRASSARSRWYRENPAWWAAHAAARRALAASSGPHVPARRPRCRGRPARRAAGRAPARRRDDRLRPRPRRARAAARARRRASSRSRRSTSTGVERVGPARARRRADLARAPTGPCGVAAEVAARARPAAPARRRDGGARHRQARAARGLRRAPACRSRRWSEDGRGLPRRAASSSSRPRRRASAGSTRVERADDLAPRGRARPAAVARRRGARRGARRRATRSPSTRSCTTAFTPLAVTDRERASAFGVATAHLYPRSTPAPRGHRRGRRGGLRGARHRAPGPTYMQIVLAAGRPARDGGRGAPRRRPRRRALPRGARRRPRARWPCAPRSAERRRRAELSRDAASAPRRALPGRAARRARARSRASTRRCASPACSTCYVLPRPGRTDRAAAASAPTARASCSRRGRRAPTPRRRRAPPRRPSGSSSGSRVRSRHEPRSCAAPRRYPRAGSRPRRARTRGGRRAAPRSAWRVSRRIGRQLQTDAEAIERRQRGRDVRSWRRRWASSSRPGGCSWPAARTAYGLGLDGDVRDVLSAIPLADVDRDRRAAPGARQDDHADRARRVVQARGQCAGVRARPGPGRSRGHGHERLPRAPGARRPARRAGPRGAAWQHLPALVARCGDGARRVRRPDRVRRLRASAIPVAAAVLYLPTGPLQELSLDSGWGEEFVALADRFDAAVAGEAALDDRVAHGLGERALRAKARLRRRLRTASAAR